MAGAAEPPMELKDGVFVPVGCEPYVKAFNSHARDFFIRFRAELAGERRHDYFLVGRTPEETTTLSRGMTSVTTLYSQYKPEFKKFETATRMVNSEGFPKAKKQHAKYVELLKGHERNTWVDVIVASWSSNVDADLGTAMHALLETRVLQMMTLYEQMVEEHRAQSGGVPLLPGSDAHMEIVTRLLASLKIDEKEPMRDIAMAAYKPEINDLTPVETRQGLQFLEEQRLNGWVPFRTEWRIFTCERYRVCGSIDLIMCHVNELPNPTNLRIVDWKRSKAIKGDSPFDRMFPPFEMFPSVNLVHYTFQLNIYRFILEKYYGNLVFKDMLLVVCHPNREKHMAVPIAFHDAEVELLFQRRAEFIAANFGAPVVTIDQVIASFEDVHMQ